MPEPHIQNIIKPEPDFDDNIIQKHLEKALNIAKDDLKSEFWEAAIRTDFVNYDCVTFKESCFNLKKSKKIYEKVEYFKLVDDVVEMMEYIECS